MWAAQCRCASLRSVLVPHYTLGEILPAVGLCRQAILKMECAFPCTLQALKEELLGSIKKGVDFVNKK